ncbi:MAG TPA: hypothetical protein VF832_00925 [Longimicrobiales bacterium]
MAQAAAIAQPRLALAAAGGAPLLGNASTLGMRLGSTPRVALQLRGSGVGVTLPAVGAGNGHTSLATSLAADGAAALYSGMSPAPTVGGVGALDLLASLGVVHGGSGFSGTPATFGIGARVGVLRESFTAPGITLSAMLRRTGGTTYTAVTDSASGSFNHISDVALRATVGKRFLALNTLIGAGLDRTSGEVSILPPPCPPGAICAAVLPTPTVAPLTQTRTVFFGDLTWTSLVFNAVAELGWQRGGSPAVPISPTGYEPLVRKGALFGSLGLRLTI